MDELINAPNDDDDDDDDDDARGGGGRRWEEERRRSDRERRRGEESAKQLELWEKENELNLLHLSTDAENDELMQANKAIRNTGRSCF